MLFQAKLTVYSATFLQLVEQASKKFVCIVDESKLVEGLGGSKGQSATVHAFAHLADALVVGCALTHMVFLLCAASKQRASVQHMKCNSPCRCNAC